MKQVIAYQSDDGTLHLDDVAAFNADLEHAKKLEREKESERRAESISKLDAE